MLFKLQWKQQAGVQICIKTTDMLKITINKKDYDIPNMWNEMTLDY